MRYIGEIHRLFEMISEKEHKRREVKRSPKETKSSFEEA